MARKSKRVSHSRRSRRSHHVRRTLGGVAPLHHTDVGWSSKMSLGQGSDYLKYHVGQHGGVQLQGADVSVIGAEGLPSALRSAALLGNQDRALDSIRGMSDQLGGRRHSKRAKKSHARKSGKSKLRGGKRKTQARKSGKRKSHGRKRHSRRRGGAHHISFAPITAQGMLLDSHSDYVKGGLSNEWNGPEIAAARARASL